jgi:hypothetical protein
MIWLLLVILLIAIFGIGTILEATLWALVIVAVLAVLAVLGVVRLVA